MLVVLKILFKMFSGATAFNQDIGLWDVSGIVGMSSVYHPFNQDIRSWNVSGVTIMGSMFSGATAFNQDIRSWNVSGVTNMIYILYGATAMLAKYRYLHLIHQQTFSMYHRVIKL